MNHVKRNIIDSLRHNPILWILPVAIVISLLLFLWRALGTDHTRYVTGSVEATKADVAAKIPARIQKFLVEEGTHVNEGDTLVRFENREVAAKMQQARAAMAAAQARYAMAMNGARKEEVAMAEDGYKQAEYSLEVLKKTYDRMKSLQAEGVISNQQWDEVDYKYRAASEMRNAAKEKFLMVKSGARAEEKDAARSLLDQARNAVAEAESYYDETSLRAPISGVVEKKIVNEGELVAAGYPLVTIVNPADWWVIVDVDEQAVGTLKVGQTLNCLLPARGKAVVPMNIARVSVMGEFATHKATNELNSFDTRSFEVKLVPASTDIQVVKGMTVLVPIGKQP